MFGREATGPSEHSAEDQCRDSSCVKRACRWGRIPKEPIMLRSRPTLVNLAIAVDAPDPPPSTGFRDDLRTANDHQPSLQRGPVTVAERDEVARPISLPQPASKALGTRARRKHAVSLDGPTASTSELADQVKTNVRRPYVRCERLSRHYI